MRAFKTSDLKIKASAHLSASLLVALSFLSACSPHAADSTDVELTTENVLAVDPHPEKSATDPLREEIGRQFIVEHFEARTNSLMLQAIKSQRPAGFVFWNAKAASGQELREVVRAYAGQAASAKGRAPLLFSTDYEGGGISFTPGGARTSGIQRFKKGMTNLVHPTWLEKSMPEYGVELCKLHGQIMAAELDSVGINYPLTMVADLQNALFALRSVSKDPAKVSACLKAASDAFYENGHVIFVTKHFPGLGQTRGDTHDLTVVSKVTDMAVAALHLAPFKALVTDSKKQNAGDLLSILASHAKFPLLDPKHITTESPTILTTIVREKMGFEGILVSDAMWMGEYAPMTLTQMLPVYLNSFVSGMDILMIKGSHYAGAVRFFRQVYDNEVDQATKTICEQRSGLKWADLRSQFIARLKQSSARLNRVTSTVGDARKTMASPGTSAQASTSTLTKRYDQILQDIDARWSDVLPAIRQAE